MGRVLVFDFDGTFTDAEAEARPYRRGSLEDIALLAGSTVEAITPLAHEIEAQVVADPDSHGWVFGDMVVAPAAVDPYLRTMPIARGILDHFGALKDPVDRERVLDRILYKYNYAKTDTVFRPGARALLQDLRGLHAWVVTNSHTGAVQGKISQLSDEAVQAGEPDLQWMVPRVRGSAKKYVVDPDFDEFEESLTLPGLGRPVLLRRRLYVETLEALRAEAGADWSDLTVVGDIFELDLVVPLILGARVILLASEHTPAYELAYLDAHPRGQVVRSLREAHALLEL